MNESPSSNQQANLARRIAALPPEKRALLTGLLTKEGLTADGSERIPRRALSGPVPLSFAQQRLWFLDQLAPGNPAYIICSAYRLAGPLHVPALGQAWSALVRRHEVLRSTFTPGEIEPTQRVGPALELELPVIDLRPLPESEREGEAERRLLEESRRPFDLESGPLLRAVLIRLADERHVLVLTLHHIVVDVFSLGPLVGELAALYEAFSAGKSDPLPPLPIQYADYAVWQRQWLQGPVIEEHLKYWREQLKDLPVLALPSDHPRPKVWSGRGAAEPISISSTVAARLHKLSQAENASLFMTLLAAFNVLLQRYTGQEDLVVGCPVANRTRSETARLIGFFANTLVLRNRLDGDPSFRQLVRQTRQVALDAIAHQELPFEKLVEALEPARSLSHNPLCQVMFTVQEAPPLALAGLHLTPWQQDIETTRFDLEVYLHHRGDALVGGMVFSTDVFDRETIRQMATHFSRLLEQLAADPDPPVSHATLLTEPESTRMLVEWNQTQRPYPRDTGLAELFRDVAKRRDELCAAQYGEERITYGELDRRSNQLARWLMGRGVGPGQLVGLYAERSVDFLVAMLGIVKARGAYLPVDLAYPAARVRAVLADGRIEVGLTQTKLLGAVSPLQGVQWLCLDEARTEIRKENDAALECRGKGEDLAYVMYTSGSTGEPKGVCVPHRAITRLVLNSDYVALSEQDVVAQVSNVAFDAATFEIWGALLNGARLVGMSKEVALSPEAFAAELREHGITTLFLTTALFNQMAQEATEGFAGIQHLLFGGEAVDPRWVRTVLRNGRPARLLHVYGPTETTTFASWHEVKELAEGDGTVPIGRPIANTELYVLDRWRKPVPVGVAGELYIGGDGLALGYWQQPELTAERFVAHPFRNGARLYRTGDLARYRADGNVEFLGRYDGQVKLRGFRVELGEIEWALRKHEHVQECTVVVREDEPGNKQLVGYVVAPAGAAPTGSALREFLAATLPDYMVPGAFVVLDKLPLNANGKVDRRALPAPDRSRREADQRYVAPRTPVEEVLAGIWSEMLQVDQVGAFDNFFDLGGHSLTATRVISRMRSVFQVGLPLRTFFEEPTVAQLARHLEAARGVPTHIPPLSPRSDSRTGAAMMSFAQQRHWILDRLGAGPYTIRMGMRVEGELDPPALERALNEVARRHDVLRSRFEEQDGQPRWILDPELKLALDVEDWRDLAGPGAEERIRRRASEEAECTMDLRLGPLVRARLARLGNRDHLLLLSVHHIVADGWGLGILIRELSQLYDAYAAGQSSPLPDLPLQYADFAFWQRQWLAGPELESQWAYWRGQLADAPPAIALPLDRPRPAVESHRGGIVSATLDRHLTEGLKSMSRREGVTLFMTLLAGFDVLLERYTGQEDIVVGTPISNRRWAETEGLIGCFVNTLALRTRLDGDPTFRELLARVRTVTLGAYDHQDLPFEKLIEELQPERDLSRNPVFQVMLALQNVPEVRVRLAGLKCQPQPLDWVGSQFDLCFGLQEGPEGIQAALEYSADVFDPATIERMFQHYATLLAAAVAHPDSRLSELPILSEAERHQLLVTWNRTERAYPREVTVMDLIESKVREAPEAVALTANGQAVTYRELDARADRLGQHLRKLGVGPDVLVALCMDPCVELLVGVLAVLKAGGAYVPLEPSHPRERLDFMLHQCQAPVVLTLDRQRHLVPDMDAHVICLDQDGPEDRIETAPRSLAKSAPEHLVWVLYTSGSTGQPKAVMIPHRAACNYLFWLRETFAFTTSDRLLQIASLSFDVAAVELFAPWSAGARVVLPSAETRYDPGALVAAVREHGITILQVVPSMLRLLVERDDFAACTSLRLVFCGGEPMTPELQRAFFAARPGTRLYNMYGPTETCVDATFWECIPQETETHVPIGRPLANVRTHILDRRGQPVPIGVRGELYVGGAGVARGYLSDPKLTAERFVPDPFQPGSGARLYRTGDGARYRPDGAIEFLGRLDHQVKIHGLRIELEEIEAQLQQHSSVRQCVVVVREDESGQMRLVAYVVRRSDQELDSATARHFLEGKLPGHMVPAAFVFVETFALLPNGKVDRRGLPAPESARVAVHDASELPSTPIEEQVAAIWGQVLHLEDVRRTDHFFELGGHSLLATQVISRIEKAFQLQLPLRVLFENPTVAAFSQAMVHLETKPGQTEKIALLLKRIDSMSAEEKQARLGRSRAALEGSGKEMAATPDV